MLVKNEIQQFRILVGIDDIFDTVFGTIQRDFEKAYNENIEFYLKGYYHHRQYDDFPGIKREHFIRSYNGRNMETLKKTTFSGVPDFLGDQVALMWNKIILEPFRDQPVIQVNFWPYVFSMVEVDELFAILRDRFAIKIKAPIKMEHVWIPPEKLTVDFVRASYSHMIMYNHNHWLNLIGDQFDVGRDLKMVELSAPAISQVCDPRFAKEASVEIDNGFISPFGAYEMFAQQVIGIQLLDAKLWSFMSSMELEIPNPYEGLDPSGHVKEEQAPSPEIDVKQESSIITP